MPKIKTVYKIKCEWDLGLNDQVYKSKKQARDSADRELKELHLYGEGDTFESFEKEGLISIKELPTK